MRQSSTILLFAAYALAQTQYGENHGVVSFDSQLVEQAAFPAPNVTLYSPAFMSNATFDPGWFEGTEGGTSPDQLGTQIPLAVLQLLILIFAQKDSSAVLLQRTLHG